MTGLEPARDFTPTATSTLRAYLITPHVQVVQLRDLNPRLAVAVADRHKRLCAAQELNLQAPPSLHERIEAELNRKV